MSHSDGLEQPGFISHGEWLAEALLYIVRVCHYTTVACTCVANVDIFAGLPVLDRMTSWGFSNHPKIDRETVDGKMPPKTSFRRIFFTFSSPTTQTHK
jgi:hypothetical protein